MNIPKYPQDFRYPKDAVPIGHDEINKRIHKCINYLEENEDAHYNYISSGDTKVTVYRLDPEDGKYEVIVSRGEYTFTIFEEEDNDDLK